MGARKFSNEYRYFLGRLREAREQAGLTQTRAAQRLRRPQSFVSKSESGERCVDAAELAEFASIYNKPLDFFVRVKPRTGR